MSDLTVAVVPLASLRPDPNNARKHSKANLDAIANSLKQFGQRRPLVVHGDTILAGNGTAEAARSLGWSKIVVTRVPDDWDYDTARAYALADNRTAELAEWDQAVLADTLQSLDAAGWQLTDLGFEPMTPPTDDEVADALAGLNQEQGELEQITFTLHRDQAEVVREALQVAKDLGEFVDTGNLNSNGNAIARVCELFLGQQV